MTERRSLPRNDGFLSAFYALASAEDAERCSAACVIVMHLSAEQRSFERTAVAAPAANSDAFTKAGACRELVYAIKRLLRGLLSSRGCARQGFATAFSRVISHEALRESTPLPSLIALLDETTACPGGLKGQEAREKLFGRIFGYAALLSSGRLYAPDASAADVAVEGKLVRELLLLGMQKPYLREVCAQAVASLIWAAPSVDVLRTRLLPSLRAQWEGECNIWTAEQLGLAFHLAHFLALRGDGDDAASLPEWVARVVALTAPTRSNAEQWSASLVDSARAFPRVHSVWGILAASPDALAASFAAGRSAASLIDDADVFGTAPSRAIEVVWSCVVEPNLVKKSATHQRKFLALELASRFMASTQTEPALLPRLLTTQLVHCIISNVGDQKSYIVEPAKRALQAIEAAITRMALSTTAATTTGKGKKKSKKGGKKGASAAELSLLFALLEKNSAVHGGRAKGSGNKRDARAKGAAMVMDVTSRLLGALDPRAIGTYVEWVAAHLQSSSSSSSSAASGGAEEESEDALEMKQLWAAQTLHSTLGNAQLPRAVEWMAAAMRALEGGAFGEKRKLSERVRTQCDAYFFRSLHSISTSAVSASLKVANNKANAAVGGLDWQALLSAVVDRQTSAVGAKSSATAASRRAAKLIRKLRASRAKLDLDSASRKRKRSEASDPALHSADALYACQVLLGAAAFRLARSAPEEEAETSIANVDELSECTDAMMKAKLAGDAVVMRAPAEEEKEGMEAEESGAEVAVPATSIVVELLLSMLSQPLPGMRDLVRAVFSLLCPSLKSDAVLQLCEIVATSKGSLDVSEGGAEEEDDGEGMPIALSELSALGNTMNAAEEGDEESGEESDDEDDDAEAAAEDDGDRKTRAERENDMLSAIVKMHIAKHDGLKESRLLKNKQFDFRLRVLDLVEAYVLRMPRNPLLARLVLPLLGALHNTGSTLKASIRNGKGSSQVRGLHERLTSVIKRKLCGSKELPEDIEAGEDISGDALHDSVEKAMKHMLGTQLPQVNETAGACVVYLLRVLARNELLQPTRVRAIFEPCVVNLICQKPTRVKLAFFVQMLKHPELAPTAFSLAPVLASIAAPNDATELKPKSAFQQAVMYDFLALILNLAVDGPLLADATTQLPGLLRAFAATARNHVGTPMGGGGAGGDAKEDGDGKKKKKKKSDVGVVMKKAIHLRLLFKFSSAMLKLGQRVIATELSQSQIAALASAGTEAAEAAAEFAVLSASESMAVKAQGKNFGVECKKWVTAVAAKTPGATTLAKPPAATPSRAGEKEEKKKMRSTKKKKKKRRKE